jgi:hypothetical protein
MTDLPIFFFPKGEEYSTVEDHPEDSTYLEVDFAIWVLWVLNARSINLTEVHGTGISPHTLWRSYDPTYHDESFGPVDIEDIGEQAPSMVIEDGSYQPDIVGIRPFVPLPWIFVGWGIDRPSDDGGQYKTFYNSPKGYILDGKFYVYVSKFNLSGDQRIEIDDKTLSHFFRLSLSLPEVSDIYEITSTFYPT